jgi:hypothetical protein
MVDVCILGENQGDKFDDHRAINTAVRGWTVNVTAM